MTTKGISEETVPLSKYQTLEKSYLALDEKVLKLEHELTWLKRNLFGKKSEKFIPHDQQMSLDIGVEPVEVPLEEEHIEYDRKKPAKKKEGHGRGHMPTHLPFKDTVIEPEEDTENSRKIGEEITWELEYDPGSLFVHRYIRPKYVKKDDNSIIIGVLPARPIEKGNFGPGFIANMIIEKYLYHMPLYRQGQKFKLHYGIVISESTASDIIKRGAFWLDAVYEAAKKDLLKSTYLMADETTIPVMIKLSKKKLKRCYYWVYYDPVRKIIIFEYRKGRSQDGPDEFLSDFKNGILQIDGYAGYNNVVDKPDIVRAACMAHVRRKFEEALGYNRKKAEYALKQIAQWFKLEAEAKKNNLSYEERLALRKKEGLIESFAEFKQWMHKQCMEEIPSSLIRKACNYAIGQWKGFEPYLTDGRVELSNNFVEGAIRPVAVGRKNYLFKGSESSAQRGAVIYSIIAMAKKHGLDPFKYIRMLLEKLPQEKSSNIQKYLPWNIK